MKNTEFNKTLSEFAWEYASTHIYISKRIVSGMFMDKFERAPRSFLRSERQKSLERQIAKVFRVMKELGIIERYSDRTVKVNREVFERFSLEDILKFSFTKKQA